MAAKKSRKKTRKKSAKNVGRDRKLVAGGQNYEVAYEAKKSGTSRARVKSARKAVGPSRKKVRKKLHSK